MRLGGQLGQQFAQVAAGSGDHFPAAADQQRVADARLLAHAIEHERLLRQRLVRQFKGHAGGFAAQIDQQVIERGTAKIYATFKRVFHAHVKPGLNALGEELQRHGVDQGAGDQRDQGKHQHQPEGKQRTEHLGATRVPERNQLVADQGQQSEHQHRIEAQQQRVMLREQRRIGARRRQKKQQHRADADTDQQQVAHRATPPVGLPTASSTGADKVNGQRFQSDERFQSRLVSAST